MAGNYPDVPGNRIAYDRDGTQVVWLNQNYTAVGGDTSQAKITALNSEDLVMTSAGGSYPNNPGVAFIFPVPMDIVGGLVQCEGGYNASAFQSSTDTTNGLDGTWAATTALGSTAGTSLVSLRNNIVPCSITGVIGFRFKQLYNRYYAIHLYGHPSTGQTLDDLVIYDSTLDQQVGGAYFDFGDVPRGSVHDKLFRVKNISPDKTAYSITLGMETLTDASPSFVAQHTLSTDGTNFSPTVNIGDLAPGAVSGQITLRQTLLTNAALSLWWARVNADADHWA
jgi:hypothetical protein